MPRSSRRSNGTSQRPLPKTDVITAAIPDDESISDGADVPESVPARASKAAPVEESEDELADGSDEEGEDEYSVEEITEHKILKGKIMYRVKWLGYDDEADMTWEPAENLETAPEKLKEYHDSVGGPPELPSNKKKGANKRTASQALESPAPSAGKKRGRKSQTNGAAAAEEQEFTLPKGSWESGISHIMSIVEEEDPADKNNPVRMGFVMWNDNQRKTKHPLKTLNTKCPQALLKYYESHLSEDVPADLKTEED